MSDQNKCPNCGVDESVLKQRMDEMMSTFTSGMSALTVEINEMRKQRSVDSQEISVLTVEINEMRKQRSVDSQEINVLTVEINEMRRQRSVDSQEISVLAAGMEEMRSNNFINVAHTQERLEEAKKTHALELQAMRFAADSTMRVLRRDLENSIDILRTANTNLTLQVTNLTTQVAALHTENTGLRMALNRIGGIGA